MDGNFAPLRSALYDQSAYVRIGAASALHAIAPRAAAEKLLDERAAMLGFSAPAEETAVLGVELARMRSDKAAQLAARLLKDDHIAVSGMLDMHDAARWADYVDSRARNAGLSERVKETLALYPRAWAGSGDDPIVRGLSASHTERGKNAREAIEYWQHVYKIDAAPPQSRRKLDDTIELLDTSNWLLARDDLVSVAIAEPDPVVRAIACHALPELGLDGSTPLMAAFSGTGVSLPREMYPTFRDRMRARLNGVGPRELGAYFAEEALQQFHDGGTARALVSAALVWDGAPQMRAERVLANMSVEAALPELTLSALNRTAPAERRAAYDLLGRIVRGDDARLGIRPHRYGAGELVTGKLDWIIDVAGRTTTARDWTAYPDIAIPVLRGAIGAMPREQAPASLPSSPQVAIDTATGFARATGGGFVDSFRRSFSWGGFSGKPTLPGVKLTRYPQAQFPANCHLGDSVSLKVRLLPTPVEGARAPFDLPFEEGKETTDLVVLAHAKGFAIEEDYQILKVPRQGPSDTATFHLRAREIGSWTIDIKFMLGTEELCHFMVLSTVSEMPTTGEAALNPIDHFTESALDRLGKARALFTVEMNHDTDKLEWSVLEAGAAAPRKLGASPLRFTADVIDKWNRQQTSRIAELVGNDLADLDGAIAQLRADGAGLFEQIAPPEVAAVFARMDLADLIVIESDADWVPWELLATNVNSGLFGERFVLARAPIVKIPPEKSPNPPEAVSPTLRRALLVVGNEILNGPELHRLTFGDYSDRAGKPLEQPSWKTLQTEVRDKDIVHFVCHGRGDNLYLSYAADPGSRLSIKQAGSLGFDPGAVVFANACSSATASPQLADFQSFGREFYLAGARPFIGTLGPVPQTLAVKFSALFYTYFALEGLTAADSMRLARLAAAKTFRRPVWLLYCLYGNTSVTRRWSPTA